MAVGSGLLVIRSDEMRVHVYKDDEGNLSVFVEPSPGKGRAPVLLRGVTAENVVEQLLPVIEAARKPKASRASRVSPA